MVLAGQQNLAENEYYYRNERLSIREMEELAPKTGVSKAVRQKSGFKAPFKIGLAIIVLIVVNVIFQALLIQRNYEMRILQGKIGDLKSQMVEIRMDMARLESFDRIQEIAQSELGMKIAGTSDYRYIAAAPQSEADHPVYSKRSEPAPKDNLWSKVNSWVANSGTAMAQGQ